VDQEAIASAGLQSQIVNDNDNNNNNNNNFILTVKYRRECYDKHMQAANHIGTVLMKYGCAPVFTGKTFQDLPRLRETADNTERYIYNVIFV
jgi:hypothetical protein